MWLDLWSELVRWKFLFVLLVDSEIWRNVDKEINTIFFLHVRIVRMPSLLWRSRIHKSVGEFAHCRDVR